jgi:nucleoside-diphosphate-sugar epimerase
MKNIAILGSTGYIGKSIIPHIMLLENVKIYLFSRSKDKVVEFIQAIEGKKDNMQVCNYAEFDHFSYDLIVNCAGIGNPAVLKKDFAAIFEVTEHFDTLIIAYLEKHPDATYLNLSSGAVYGTTNTGPFLASSKSLLCINELNQSEYYSVAKINSEAKHRALKHLNIVDVRVFSFFSSFVDTDANFLLSEIVRSLKNKTVFETSNADIVRDFITPFDLVQAIKIILDIQKINDSFDIYSLSPITKFEILKLFSEKFGLEFKVIDDIKLVSPTGVKNEYYPMDRKMETLGYAPKYSSLSGIEAEMQYIRTKN